MKSIKLLAAALAACSTAAAAHVTVWPKQSAARAHERYTVRVPDEKPIDTVAIELRFPAGLRVTSFEQEPGWLTEPLRDASGKLIGVRWTGRLPPQEFTEFGLLAVNPDLPGDLTWPAVQTYADGTTIRWSGEPASKTPAPRVSITPRALNSPRI